MEKRAFYWMSMAVFVCAISMMFARPGGKTIPMPSLLKTGCSWTAVSISGRIIVTTSLNSGLRPFGRRPK